MNWMQVREILDDIFEVAIKSPDYSVYWEYIPDSFKNLEQVSRIEMWGYLERYGVIDDKNIFNGNFNGYKLNKEWIGFAESGGWRAIGKATRMFDYSLNKRKRYTAIFDFGYTTDSLDITGERTSDVGYVPSREEIIQVTIY